MPIWVDADACPKPIKDILFRAAERTGESPTLVANHPMAVPRRPNVRLLQVPGGFDVADAEITGRVAPGDLVVTIGAGDVTVLGPRVLEVLAAGAGAGDGEERPAEPATSGSPA